jgi:elongation factor Ts
MAKNLTLVKKLREETQASIADIHKAVEESGGDHAKALALLRKRGAEIAEKKKERETGQGLVESYIHGNGKVGSVIVLLCETDFVARTQEFKQLAHELAMQVASMDPKDTKDLLSQDYIRDGSMKIEDLIKQAIGKMGENIVVKDFKRFEL